MNERIRKLALQARAEVRADWDKGNKIPYPEAHDAFQRDNDQKFAELIVRECADTVTDRCEMRNESDVKRAEYYAKRIKEHFGVEE